MSIDWLLLNEEDYVCEGWVVDNCAHVAYQRVDRLIVNFILFQLADIKDANVIQPLAAIEASEDEQLLGSNHAGSVSLSSSWSFFKLERMAPSHGFCVEDVEVI